MDPPLPLPVALESRLDQETAQLVFSTPHRPCRRMEDGEMVCGALGTHTLTTPHSTQHLLAITPMGQSGWVLLENTLPFAVQASIDHGGHRDELVCPPLPRDGGAEMVCGSVLTSPISYEEGVRWCVVGWGGGGQRSACLTSQATQLCPAVWCGTTWEQLEPCKTPHTTTYPNCCCH